MKADFKIAKSHFHFSEHVKMFVWLIVNRLFLNWLPRRQFNTFTIFVYKLFGAKCGRGCEIYSTAFITMPWKFKMGDFSTLGPAVKIINHCDVFIGSNTTISQDVLILTTSHDFRSLNFNQIRKPVFIGDNIWVASHVIIGPGVKISNASIIQAGCRIFTDVGANKIVLNPENKLINNV
jgi:putative colanic acid biosynthesis acetyltransferase WcaF